MPWGAEKQNTETKPHEVPGDSPSNIRDQAVARFSIDLLAKYLALHLHASSAEAEANAIIKEYDMTDTQSIQKPPQSSPAMVPATTSLKNQAMEPKSDEKSSENSRTVVPTGTAYTIATVKERPLEFALKIIQVCEEASAVEQNVKELQAKDEEGSKEAVVKSIQGDIKELVSTVGTINEDLTKISEQNRWVIAIYKEVNTSTLDDCMSRLSTAMQRFTLANDLRDSALINELLGRLRKMANKVDNMNNKVEDIHKYLFRIKTSATLVPSDTFARQ
ncbi:hypothetical protein M413DRAFT_26754 [Hebeloma cylindrosporum]|uniref:Uncharacterized protein n=1 Tax=Hebeloma cylindrosporum TaxID=76867 RepID=A0A0C3C1J2_HEBCY|nr:hypothetical protein M413DRAFT_26754 [Hebeloma cylindrosporum h7]